MVEKISLSMPEEDKRIPGRHFAGNRRSHMRVPISVLVCRVARHAEFFRIPLRGMFRACSMGDISLGGFSVVAAHKMKAGDKFELLFQTPDTVSEHRIEGVVVNHRQVAGDRFMYGCKRRSELDSSLIEHIVRKTLNRNLALRAISA